jgi:hypothetical protein
MAGTELQVHANSSRLLSSEGKDTGSDQGTCLPPLAPTKPVVQLEGRNLLENGNHDAEKVAGDRAIRDLRQPSGASLQPLQVLILWCDVAFSDVTWR